MATVLNIDDLPKYKKQEIEIREQLRKLRFDHKLGQLDDPSQIKKNKAELARILTKMTQIERSGNQE